MKGQLGDLFDAQQLLTDVSGSGNNWAHGHHLYGPQYRDDLLDSIRRPVEACESLQSFLLLQSLGGGTGSGLGCYILTLLEVQPLLLQLKCPVQVLSFIFSTMAELDVGTVISGIKLPDFWLIVPTVQINLCSRHAYAWCTAQVFCNGYS